MRRKVDMFVSLGIVLVAFMVKWPAFAQPLTAYFGSYQAINAMMAEMMGGGSISDFFIPRVFLLQGGAPSLHLLYYPFGSLVAYFGDYFLGGGIPWWGRFQSGIFVAGASVLMFPISRRFGSETKAILTVFFFSFFPMVLLSGIVFQNEAAALFFLVLSFWLLGFSSFWSFIFSGLCFSLALTARIHFLVALPAFLVYLNRDKIVLGRSFLFFLCAAIPVTGWTVWIRFLELRYADQVFTSLFSQAGDGRVMDLWLLAQPSSLWRIAKILGGYCWTPLLAPVVFWGLFRFKRENVPLLLWAWASFALILLVPQKVLDHPFYLLLGAPPSAILIASVLENPWTNWKRRLKFFFCCIFVLLALRFYLPPAFHLEGSDRNVKRVGDFVDRIAAPDAKVIAQHGTSPDLLYYCHRKGWEFDLAMYRGYFRTSKQLRHRRLVKEGYGDPVAWLESLRMKGAEYLVISEPDQLLADVVLVEHLRKNYSTLPTPDSSFLIFNLGGE